MKINVNKRIIGVIYRLNSIVNSRNCSEFLNLVHRKSSVNLTETFQHCLEDVENFLRKNINIVNSLKLSTFAECFEKCIDIAEKYLNLFKTIENYQKYTISALTSFGDSKISKETAEDIVKRSVRHLEIDKETAIIHIVRFRLAKSFLQDLTKCLIRQCGKEELKEGFEELVNNILSRVDKSNEQIELVLKKLNEWCNEYKIC